MNRMPQSCTSGSGSTLKRYKKKHTQRHGFLGASSVVKIPESTSYNWQSAFPFRATQIQSFQILLILAHQRHNPHLGVQSSTQVFHPGDSKTFNSLCIIRACIQIQVSNVRHLKTTMTNIIYYEKHSHHLICVSVPIKKKLADSVPVYLANEKKIMLQYHMSTSKIFILCQTYTVKAIK